MKLKKLELKINTDPSVFNGIPCLYLTIDTTNGSDGCSIDYIPPKIKGRYGSLPKFVGRLLKDLNGSIVHIPEKYYDTFFYSLSTYVREQGYKVNHIVIKDVNKLKNPETWKILYSIDYKTVFRVQLLVEDMPKIPPKFLTTINITSPKAWITTIMDPTDPRKLDSKFVTKSDEMLMYLNTIEDCENADTYLTLQKYLMCPVILIPTNNNLRYKVKELAKIHNARYFTYA